MRSRRPRETQLTNYRQTRRSQDRTLVILVILVLVVGGTGLIGLIWGARTAVLGSLCLMSGGVLIGGLWLLLGLIERVVGD